MKQRDRQPRIWLLHRDDDRCAALYRLAQPFEPSFVGSPVQAPLEAGSRPDLVVLGVAGDREVELDFAHRAARHFERASRSAGQPPAKQVKWVLVPDRSGNAEQGQAAQRAQRELASLFDGLDAVVLDAPITAPALRAAIGAALEDQEVHASLRARRRRDALAERFGRWFGDLELPELLRAMDPKLSEVPLVVRGEAGCGRSLLVRYVHSFGATSDERVLVEVPCASVIDATDILDAIERAAHDAHAATVLLSEVHQLDIALQDEVRSWIEFGLPSEVEAPLRLRWAVSLDEDAHLLPALDAALAGLTLQIPPLRERAQAIDTFVQATAARWSEGNAGHPRSFASDALRMLEAQPWLGNLRELEALVFRSLAAHGRDPVRAADLTSLLETDRSPEATSCAHLPVNAAETVVIDADLLRDEAENEASPADWDTSKARLDENRGLPHGDEAEEELLEPDYIDDEADDEASEVAARFDRSFDDDLAGEYDDSWHGASDAASEDAEEDEWDEEAPNELEDEEEDDLLEPEYIADELERATGIDRGLHEGSVPSDSDLLDATFTLSGHPVPEAAPAALAPGPAAHASQVIELSIDDLAEPWTPAQAPVPATPTAASAPRQARLDLDDDAWRRVLGAAAEQLRIPASSIRKQAGEGANTRVSADLARIDDVIERLEVMALAGEGSAEPVDLSELLESLLAEMRDEIAARHLLVLKELDHKRPIGLANRLQLRFALDALLRRLLEGVDNGGDLYLASSHNPSGKASVAEAAKAEQGASVRVLIRHAPAASSDAQKRACDPQLELAVVSAVVRSAGGRFAVHRSAGGETVVVLDLNAPF